MPSKNDNMNNNILDLKVFLAGLGYFVVSFANIDAIIKIISFFLISAFTLRRWYLMEKNNKKE